MSEPLRRADNEASLEDLMKALGARARAAAGSLALASPDTKTAALKAMAGEIRSRANDILTANASDMRAAEEKGLSGAMLDRLLLTPERVEAMAAGIETVAGLEDPIGRELARWTRPNGLEISRIAVPIGVIGIIYESRPNVTADAGAICLKSGNAAILRGGSESAHSSAAIAACLAAGLDNAGLDPNALQIVPTTDRAAVGLMLAGLDGSIDIIVPRGGKSLVARVQAEARVPVLAHLEGLCHVYVDGAADPDMAREIVLNAKMRRTGICGAAETLLIDKSVLTSHGPAILEALREAGCEIRGAADIAALGGAVTPASEEDFYTEYLDAIISVRSVDGVAGALAHIARYGSRHTDCIVTGDAAAASRFTRECDSAIVLVNASTQFADGGEFGFGAEIGIATGKLHARGPVGVDQLTTYKYVVRGTGQTRP